MGGWVLKPCINADGERLHHNDDQQTSSLHKTGPLQPRGPKKTDSAHLSCWKSWTPRACCHHPACWAGRIFPAWQEPGHLLVQLQARPLQQAAALPATRACPAKRMPLLYFQHTFAESSDSSSFWRFTTLPYLVRTLFRPMVTFAVPTRHEFLRSLQTCQRILVIFTLHLLLKLHRTL